MSRHLRACASFAVVAAALVWAPPARSGSFDFLFDMTRVSDDNQNFMHLAVSSYGVPRPTLEPLLPAFQGPYENDLSVALFLSGESGRSLQFIVDQRRQGYSWAFVFGRCGVPPDVLFVGIDRDPGPPYGNAWGYWKKRGRAVRLRDADIINLSQLQIGHRISGMPVRDLLSARSGRTVYAVVADRKGRPWKGGKSGPPGVRTSRSPGGPPAGGPRKGNSGGKGKGPKKG